MNNKDYTDYSEAEFLKLVQEIFNGADKSEEQSNNDVGEFNRIVGHPSGSDLIFYPKSSDEPTPESVVNEVKEWRVKNGLPGLKDS
jgi:hypothetical protein